MPRKAKVVSGRMMIQYTYQVVLLVPAEDPSALGPKVDALKAEGNKVKLMKVKAAQE